MTLPNFMPIGRSFYVVRTQAGFKQAVRHFVGADEYPLFKARIEGYPDSYPSVVHLNIGYRGDSYVRATCMHVNEFRKGLDKADPQ